MRHHPAGNQIRIGRSPQSRRTGDSVVLRWRNRGRLLPRAHAVLCSSEPVPPAMNFLDVSCFLQLLNDARQVATSAMLQVHAMRDLANGRGLRLLGEMRDHFLTRDFRGAWLLVFDSVLASHALRAFQLRLTDFRLRSKT